MKLEVTLKVGDLMTVDPVTLCPDDSLREVAALFETRRFRHLPVTDEQGRIVGLLSHRDFLTLAVSKLAHLRQTEVDELYAGIRIRDVMGRKVTTVTADVSLAVAAGVMLEKKYGCLPVVDPEDGRLVGILTEADFVRALAELCCDENLKECDALRSSVLA